MKHFILTIIGAGLMVFATAQTKIKGIIMDKKSGTGISYANLGIPNQNIGTITDSSGSYRIEILNVNFTDSIIVSCIGYETFKTSLETFSKNPKIGLQEKIYGLNEVIVLAKRVKTEGREKSHGIKVLFNRKDSTKTLAGGEIAMLFSNRDKIRITGVNFYLANNSYENIKVRVNIYNAKDTDTDKKLNNTGNIFTITEGKTGWITANFENENIILNKQDYVVAIEILQISPRSGQLAFLGGFKPYARKTMVRDVSFGKWKKQPLNLSLYTKFDIL